jgi:Na+/H+ antiporter
MTANLQARDAVLLVLALTLVIAVIGRRVRTPLPIVLAGVGLVLGLLWTVVEGLPPVRLSGDIVLFIFLPPLLTRASYALPLGALRSNLRSIGMLAFGLVLVTMLGAAWTMRLFDSTIPWAAALVLGAIVSPPDPVAATAVSRRTGLPHRLVTILEGEGLLNDAVAIVAYQLALEAATSGDFSWGHTALALAREAPVGLVIGLAAGWVSARVRRGMRDVNVEAALSLFLPYATYELATRAQASGVLAVVAFGLYMRRSMDERGTPIARMASRTVWSAVELATTTVVFMLVGIELGVILPAVLTPARLLAGIAVTVAVIALRMLWMHSIPHLLRVAAVPGGGGPVPTRGELTVLGWSGMRGVVSLALAVALPTLAGDDQQQHIRMSLIAVSTVVVLVTLLVQGVTLLPLVDWLQVGDPDREQRDEDRTRHRAARAGQAALARMAASGRLSDERRAAIDARLQHGDIGLARARMSAVDCAALGTALDAQREVITTMREGGRIGDSLASALATELDVDAVRLQGESARLAGEG